MRYRKYHKTKKQAQDFLSAWRVSHPLCGFGIYKMPKGSRHPGMYAVCTYIEWLNTY